jgi:6,7-dimethyl-8-ribityllumazine synthase
MVQKSVDPTALATRSEPSADGYDGRVLIIEARYYEAVADELAAGAIAELEAHGVPYDRVAVPGALEIPQALSAAIPLFEDTYVGAIVLGCVIRGETSHYDVVVGNTNHWLMEIAINSMIPVGNAVLTVDTMDQALARAKGGRTGKGGDAARACLRLIEIERTFAEQVS